MKLALYDPSPAAARQLAARLRQYGRLRSLRMELTLFSESSPLLCDVEEGAWFDAVFLALSPQAPEALATARRLRQTGYTGKLLLLAPDRRFALESCEVEAFAYLLTPVAPAALFPVLDRLTRDFDALTYCIKQRHRIILLSYNEILYVESRNSKCLFHTGDGLWTVYKRLDTIQDELDDPRFLRSHKSFLVNMDYVCRAEENFELLNGDRVPIRQRTLRAIRLAYEEYITEKLALPSY